MKVEFLYRYEAESYSSVDEWDNVYTNGPTLKLKTYPVVSETPCGYWLGGCQLLTDTPTSTKWKWVSKTSRKRFAHPTKKEALEAYKIRKQYYVGHCEKRLNKAKSELALATHKLKMTY